MSVIGGFSIERRLPDNSAVERALALLEQKKARKEALENALQREMIKADAALKKQALINKGRPAPVVKAKDPTAFVKALMENYPGMTQEEALRIFQQLSTTGSTAGIATSTSFDATELPLPTKSEGVYTKISTATPSQTTTETTPDALPIKTIDDYRKGKVIKPEYRNGAYYDPETGNKVANSEDYSKEYDSKRAAILKEHEDLVNDIETATHAGAVDTTAEFNAKKVRESVAKRDAALAALDAEYNQDPHAGYNYNKVTGTWQSDEEASAWATKAAASLNKVLKSNVFAIPTEETSSKTPTVTETSYAPLPGETKAAYQARMAAQRAADSNRAKSDLEDKRINARSALADKNNTAKGEQTDKQITAREKAQFTRWELDMRKNGLRKGKRTSNGVIELDNSPLGVVDENTVWGTVERDAVTGKETIRETSTNDLHNTMKKAYTQWYEDTIRKPRDEAANARRATKDADKSDADLDKDYDKYAAEWDKPLTESPVSNWQDQYQPTEIIRNLVDELDTAAANGANVKRVLKSYMLRYPDIAKVAENITDNDLKSRLHAHAQAIEAGTYSKLSRDEYKAKHPKKSAQPKDSNSTSKTPDGVKNVLR